MKLLARVSVRKIIENQIHIYHNLLAQIKSDTTDVIDVPDGSYPITSNLLNFKIKR